MKNILLLTVFLQTLLISEELQIKANSFDADQAKGVTVLEGSVNIIKHNDELNASKVIIYTNKQNQPTKFIATGNVSFKIQTQLKAEYEGEANKVIYLPLKKEYHFFKNVLLKQINEKKEIQGDEVILNTISGKAYAKGLHKKPVIMTFDIADEKEKK